MHLYQKDVNLKMISCTYNPFTYIDFVGNLTDYVANTASVIIVNN